MHLDLPYLALCMLFNLIPVPPYARKANATPSMQPPHTHLPTYLPTYNPPFFLSSYRIPRYTSSNHPNSLPTLTPQSPHTWRRFLPIKKTSSFIRSPSPLTGWEQYVAHPIPQHLSRTKQATPHHATPISAAVSKANIGPERSEARRSFMHAMQVSCA